MMPMLESCAFYYFVEDVFLSHNQRRDSLVSIKTLGRATSCLNLVYVFCFKGLKHQLCNQTFLQLYYSNKTSQP